jgi:hypothetical protein
MTPIKKPRKKPPKKLIANLQKALNEMGWDMHMPITDKDETIPYAIIGRPLFAAIIRDYLDEAGVNNVLEEKLHSQISLKKQS